MIKHVLLTRTPLQSGGKFISEPLALDTASSMRGWVHCDEDGKLAIFQSFDRRGDYRKIYDVPVNKGELTTFSIPVYSKFGLVVFAQGLVGSTELEIVLNVSAGDGEVTGTRNVTVNQHGAMT